MRRDAQRGRPFLLSRRRPVWSLAPSAKLQAGTAKRSTALSLAFGRRMTARKRPGSAGMRRRAQAELQAPSSGKIRRRDTADDADTAAKKVRTPANARLNSVLCIVSRVSDLAGGNSVCPVFYSQSRRGTKARICSSTEGRRPGPAQHRLTGSTCFVKAASRSMNRRRHEPFTLPALRRKREVAQCHDE